MVHRCTEQSQLGKVLQLFHRILTLAVLLRTNADWLEVSVTCYSLVFDHITQ